MFRRLEGFMKCPKCETEVGILDSEQKPLCLCQPSSASAGIPVDRLPDICPSCLDNMLQWLDKSGDDVIELINQLSPDEGWRRWKESGLMEVLHHFRFVATRIRTLPMTIPDKPLTRDFRETVKKRLEDPEFRAALEKELDCAECPSAEKDCKGLATCAQQEKTMMVVTSDMGNPMDDLLEFLDPGGHASEQDMGPMCGRCYDFVEVFPANCEEKPEALLGAPIGMYHCPDCGAMVLAGIPHPPLCKPCLTRTHPAFDLTEEQK